MTITAKDFSFSADDVNVSTGDALAITFKNGGSASHTLTFYSDAEYKHAIAGADTGGVGGGATTALMLVAGDGMYYRCNIHPSRMQGEIKITTTQSPGQTPQGTPAGASQSAPPAATSSAVAAVGDQPTAPAVSTEPTEAAVDSQPTAPSNPAPATQAPIAAATPMPTIAAAPTKAAATVPAKNYTPPYNY